MWDADELKDAHREESAKYGNQPDRIVNAAGITAVVSVSEEERNRRAQEAVTHAKNHLSERQAAFDHYEVVREALKHGLGHLRLRDVERAFEQRREQDDLIPVQHYRAAAPGTRYTTPEMIRLERQTLERMKAGQGKMTALAPQVDERFLDANYSRLNAGQRETVRRIVQSHDQVTALQGGAGTGKTTSLEAIRQLAERQGYEVKGLAPTSRATNALQQAGIPSETLQMHLQRGAEEVRETPTPRLYFLDETSLASTKQVHQFLERLDSEDRVVLIGDTRQHQAVEAGRIFEELQQAGITTVRLDQIVRQQEAPELKAVVEDLAAGNVVAAVEKLDDQNRIHEFEDREKRFAAIAQAYAAAPESTLAVSPDNQSRRELNQSIRQALRETGHIGEDRYRVPVLMNRQDITAEDRKLAHSYKLGHVLRYSKGSQIHGLEKGGYATVHSIDPERNQLTVETANGAKVTYDPKRLSGVQVYLPEHRSFAEGDRIQFTNPWRQAAVANRDLATITRLDAQGNVTVKLDDSRRKVSWNLQRMKHIDHGYAITSYSSQGTTVDRVLVHADTSDSKTRALVDKTLAYVALSRPRYDAQVYTDNKFRLSSALSRDHQKPMALAPEQIRQYRNPTQEIPMQTQPSNDQSSEVKPDGEIEHDPSPAPAQTPEPPQQQQDQEHRREQKQERQIVHSIGL